jgi:hypothetical protein
MTSLINTLHSYNRYLILAALLFVLYRTFSGWFGKKPYVSADNSASAALLGLSHLQLLLGLIQYFVTTPWFNVARTNMAGAMKDPWQRYFTVEHITTMIIAVALIQIGRIASKRAKDPVSKHRKMAIYTAIATLLIVATLAQRGILIGTAADAMGK